MIRLSPNSRTVTLEGPTRTKWWWKWHTDLAIVNQALKCDIAAKRVDMTDPLFLRHSITDESHETYIITCTSPSLLLADKISTVTVADQGDVSRRYTLQVITHDDPPQILVKTLSFNFCISTWELEKARFFKDSPYLTSTYRPICRIGPSMLACFLIKNPVWIDCGGCRWQAFLY